MLLLKKTMCRLLLLVFLFQANIFIAFAQKTVLFDENHGQLFLTGKTGELDLSGLDTLFQKEGWLIKTANLEINDEALSGVDALVISGAFKPISQTEKEAILRFINKGGKLSVMIHIGFPVADLLHELNVSISNGVIHEKENIMQHNDLEFYILNLKEHPLTNKLKQFSINGGWALLPTNDNAQIIAQTSEKSWIDLNGDNIADAQQAFATVIAGTMGSGNFVVFSDDAIFQNKFLKENNYLLGQNLISWLKK